MAEEAVLAGFLICELIGGKQGIHRSRTKPLQIEGDEFESQLLENRRKLGGHRRVEGSVHFPAGDLNASDIAVVTDAKLPEAERANRIFAALDHIKCFARHGAPVFDAGRKARRRRFVPDSQAC